MAPARPTRLSFLRSGFAVGDVPHHGFEPCAHILPALFIVKPVPA